MRLGAEVLTAFVSSNTGIGNWIDNGLVDTV